MILKLIQRLFGKKPQLVALGFSEDGRGTVFHYPLDEVLSVETFEPDGQIRWATIRLKRFSLSLPEEQARFAVANLAANGIHRESHTSMAQTPS